MASVKDLSLKTVTKSIANAVSDVLANSEFISRTIGMNNSYEDIMFIVQALGREPISLLGKDYAFIYDHVRRNYMQGMDIPSKDFEYCNKFTFYKEIPTVKFADPYNDPMNLLDRWKPNFETLDTHNSNVTYHYSESNDGYTNNKYIEPKSDLDSANPGVANGSIGSFAPSIQTCDMIGKTNSNFNHGKYETLIARFHTNSEDSKSQTDPTQTANSRQYGQSHGRNLLKITPDEPNGYNNPYCRVWTYHHQYNQVKRQIRPFDEDYNTQVKLESNEQSGNYDTVGFRTAPSKNYGFDGGSKRLDDNGVLNYQNGLVNIAPTAKIKDYFDHKDGDYDKGIINVKKCMFSIENLAWRDTKSRRDEFDAYGLSPEQKGPFGGRIMWFPPYNLKFNENVTTNWNSNKFIGRGEDVYTYTNTERRGDLSFTLLIDHPSILDYWTSHERNGMKNRGQQLAEGNSGGIDNKMNQENTLLRFFAGCDILTAKPQLYRVRNIKPKEEEKKEEEVKETPPAVDEIQNKVPKKICAVLYYPNNYSGKDDRNGVVDPVWYLMNGIGTQKRVNEITKNADDFGVDIHSNITCSKGDGYGGYEMGAYGISVATSELNAAYSAISGTYADTQSKERKAQYLTGPSGKNDKISAYYNNGTPQFGTEYLAKIVGSQAMSMGGAKTQSNLTGPRHLWYRKRYYYRVDKAYENQDFDNPKSYIDGDSHRLNNSGYGNLRQHSKIEEYFGIERDDSDTYKLVSFSDLFIALEGDNTVVSKVNPNDVDLIRKVLKGNDNIYSNVKISFNGHASKQGRVSSNNDLAKNRALTIKNWMKDKNLKSSIKYGEPTVKVQTDSPTTNMGEVDDEVVKIWRSAAVIIEYEEFEIENPAEAMKRINANPENGEVIKDKDGKPTTTVESVEVKNKETSSNNIRTTSDWLHNTPQGQMIMATHPEIAMYGLDKTLTIEDIEKMTGANYTDSDNWETYDNSYQQLDDYKQSVVKRYDNEGEFFQTLSNNEAFMHNLISNKIKYFDPAFHSISPEGFNSRLTFLHQCTRQGATVGNADGSPETTAYNLAFGRPPVCVLRIGDFYYTKIIINSITINYDQPQWDMNPEGIGMMPMYADINIQFTFIGGSDLGGPIARLQNAVSFNYYANASVYDNRAEMVEYDPEGSGKEIKFKGFNYPNRYVGNKLRLDRIGEVDNQGKIYAEDF